MLQLEEYKIEINSFKAKIDEMGASL